MPSPTKEEIEGFSIDVVKVVNEKNLSYLDAVIFICESRNMDPEVAGSLVSPLVKERIQCEAEALHIIKSTNKKTRLPF